MIGGGKTQERRAVCVGFIDSFLLLPRGLSGFYARINRYNISITRHAYI